MKELINDALAFSAVIGGFTASMVAFAKSPVGKFFARSVKRDLKELVLESSKEANRPVEEKLLSMESYTRYHLGPNGLSPALHKRIEALETSSDKMEDFIEYQKEKNHDIINKSMALSPIVKILEQRLAKLENALGDPPDSH